MAMHLESESLDLGGKFYLITLEIVCILQFEGGSLWRWNKAERYPFCNGGSDGSV